MNEFLQERATLYVSGTMTLQEREEFELMLEFHAELREFATRLAEAWSSVTLAALGPGNLRPAPELKARILGAAQDHPQHFVGHGLVVSSPDGLVQWINPAFSAMCGYSLDELRGKKLGPILQGEKTDHDTAERLRHAVHSCQPCREVILNYHKNGAPYLTEIELTPIFDGDGQPLWLAARERKIAEVARA